MSKTPEQNVDQKQDQTQESLNILERERQTRIKREHQENLLLQVHRDYQVADNQFYFKDRSTQLAFKDKGDQLTTSLNDERVRFSMLTIAKAKGWESIKITGHPDFKREIWLEASLQGIQVKGYEPKELDLKELNARQSKLFKNKAQQQNKGSKPHDTVQAHESKSRENKEDKPEKGNIYHGILVSHGYDTHDPNKEKSYYVTLATEKGQKTLRDKDLKQTMDKISVAPGDAVKLEYKGNQPVMHKESLKGDNGKMIESIKTSKSTWHAEKTDRSQIIESVVAALMTQKSKDPSISQGVINKVTQELEKRVKEGKNIPKVPIYDQRANAKVYDIDRSRLPVERDTERTR